MFLDTLHTESEKATRCPKMPKDNQKQISLAPRVCTQIYLGIGDMPARKARDPIGRRLSFQLSSLGQSHASHPHLFRV